MSPWYDSTPKKSRRKLDSNPGPSALEADALTTRPTRRSRLERRRDTGTEPRFWGRNSSVGSVLGSLSCLMQRHGFDPPPRRFFFLVEGTFPLELTRVLTPFPQILSDESMNRGLVRAHIHSTRRTQKIPAFMSQTGENTKHN